MNVNTVEQVKQCRTPQEALLLLAAAIDELAVDPWHQPLEWVAGDATQPGWDTHVGTTNAELQGLQNIVEATYPDNRAKIENGDVIVKPVSHERQVDRADFAHEAQLQAFYGPSLSPPEFEEAYVKGGPRWLYYTNRECVMQMPMDLRQRLVADIVLDSPEEAAEISRDILKKDDSVDEGTQIDWQRSARELGPLA